MILIEKLKNSAKQKRECLHSRKLQCFGHLEKMKRYNWLVKCTMLKENKPRKG